ncbi:hypothetical protein K438DRAFT_1765385 [Mycena galopus ATCC 62051]|nr:hypothetical protein K438DRAFT_1765385 [Mycena galopus ATCC 62051]
MGISCGKKILGLEELRSTKHNFATISTHRALSFMLGQLDLSRRPQSVPFSAPPLFRLPKLLLVDLNHQPPCLHIRVTFKLKLASTSTCQGPAHLVTHAVVAPTARYTVIHARLDNNTVGLTQDELEAVERAVHSFNAIRASVDSALPLDTSWANPISEVGRPQQHCLALSPQSAIGCPGTTGRVYQSKNEFSGSGTRPVPLHHLKSATQSH